MAVPATARATSNPSSVSSSAHGIDPSAPLVIIADFHVKTDQIDAFADAVDGHAARSRKEAEVLAFDVAQDPADRAHFTLWEVYPDAAAHERHKKSASSLAFWPVVTPLLVRQPGGGVLTTRQLQRRVPLDRQ